MLELPSLDQALVDALLEEWALQTNDVEQSATGFSDEFVDRDRFLAISESAHLASVRKGRESHRSVNVSA